ncbi:bifunctional folylpolyglutamate synthase/dihydrofolate synthase [Bacillus tianshenii]|uniref:bifunctional folylpolyglutamate synthase/dihydrofolate synthase n=1 Tax=Sutcliffiella tianshenii TaxID=1463404 RepID=UPI001CD793D9|nr:folylpolyglutamate synthase/dihydrofolate synthase family protein [Bacillus tianshenii]MCA1318737.1 bifunctional folylpolyglutamate synthase/dihydrofolate synthase [Bacillus tianshenii]
MIHTYEEALDWIHSRLRFGIKPGIKRMEWMMEKLGHPERKFKTIHVAGTNGKGSTVTYIRHILQEAGYRVGTFTSPYIEQFNERISVDGVPFANEDLVKLVNLIKPLADELEDHELGSPTEFEVITAMSFYYFRHMAEVDIAVYETGLGGRFDSTNIITPLVSVITNIGHDHQAILGDSLAEIAYEKAGIIKHGVPVITAVAQEEARRVIVKVAKEKKSRLYQLSQELKISNYEATLQGERFSLHTPFGGLDDLKISMKGRHQVDNAALAVMACEYVKNYYSFFIEEEHIRQGLEKAFWAGRMEEVSLDPLVVLDGAHNKEGMEKLAETVKDRYKDKHVHILFTALSDKPLDEMISLLDKVADTITFTSFDFPRAAGAEILSGKSKHPKKRAVESWKNAVQSILSGLGKDDLLLITGSLYFISEVRTYFTDNG